MISRPPPRPKLRRQSSDVWPERRWPQNDITFAVWSLTLHGFSNCFLKRVFFCFFVFIFSTSVAKSGLLAGQALATMQNQLPLIVLFAFCFEERLHHKYQKLSKLPIRFLPLNGFFFLAVSSPFFADFLLAQKIMIYAGFFFFFLLYIYFLSLGRERQK